MPPSLAPEIATPRLPPSLRACGPAIALSLTLLSACTEPSGAVGSAEKPAATSAESAPAPSAPPPTFMQIGSVTADVGEAPAAPVATAAAANDRAPEAPPPLPRGGKPASAGDVPA